MRYAILLLVPLLALLAACVGAGEPEATPSPAVARRSPTPQATAEPAPQPDTAPPRVFFKRANELWSTEPDGSDPLLLSTDALPGYYGGVWGDSGPRPSPQRDKVSFIGSDKNLWVVDSLGKNLNRLSEEAYPGDETSAATDVLMSGWSPDGKKIIYYVEAVAGLERRQEEPLLIALSGLGRPQGQPPQLGFYLVDVNTGAKARVSDLPNFVAWSADPESVLYEQRDQSTAMVDWYTLNLETGAASKLTVIPFTCFSLQPSLSSDGSKLLYGCGNVSVGVVPPDPGSSKIVLAGSDNTDQKVLLEGQWADLQFPALSPSGEAFVYQHRLDLGDGRVGFELTLYDLTTAQQKVLASGFIISHGWADSKSVLFLESSDNTLSGSSTLYKVDVTSGARTKLADDVTFE